MTPHYIAAAGVLGAAVTITGGLWLAWHRIAGWWHNLLRRVQDRRMRRMSRKVFTSIMTVAAKQDADLARLGHEIDTRLRGR